MAATRLFPDLLRSLPLGLTGIVKREVCRSAAIGQLRKNVVDLLEQGLNDSAQILAQYLLASRDRSKEGVAIRVEICVLAADAFARCGDLRRGLWHCRAAISDLDCTHYKTRSQQAEKGKLRSYLDLKIGACLTALAEVALDGERDLLARDAAMMLETVPDDIHTALSATTVGRLHEALYPERRHSAAQWYQLALRKNPLALDAATRLAKLRESYPPTFVKALRQQSASWLPSLLEAIHLYYNLRPRSSLAKLRQLQSLFPKCIHLMLLRSQCELQTLTPDVALKTLTEVHKSDPHCMEMMDVLAVLMRFDFKQSERNHGTSQTASSVQFQEAQSKTLLKQQNMAVFANELLESNPRHPAAWLACAFLHTIQSQVSKDRVLAALDRGLGVSRQRHGLTLLTRIEWEFQHPDENMPISKLRNLLESALEREPNNFSIITALVRTDLSESNYAAGESRLTPFLQDDAECPQMICLYARVKALMQDHLTAKKYLRLVIEKNPKFLQAYYQLACVHTNVKEFDEAAKLLSALTPKRYPLVHTRLGRIALSQNKPHVAHDIFNSVLTFCAENREALDGIEDVQACLKGNKTNSIPPPSDPYLTPTPFLMWYF